MRFSKHKSSCDNINKSMLGAARAWQNTITKYDETPFACNLLEALISLYLSSQRV